MTNFDQQHLLKKYREDQCTEEEIQAIEAWYADWNRTDRIFLSEEELDRVGGMISENVMARIQPKVTRSWPRIAVAASLTAVLLSGLWLYYSYFNLNTQVSSSNDVPAGKNTALLTLADGKKVKLSEAKSGLVIDASHFTYADGTPVYNNNVDANTAPSKLNTINTPRGGTYQIILADGTKVWLNASSSLKFPSTFSKNAKRNVELTGEAYFQVRKDPAHPFVVQTAMQEVEVLGTHFNINSYPDEQATITTLEEGAVKVLAVNDQDIALLHPGQQSRLSGKSLEILPANMETALAWKNGQMVFEDANIKTIMREVSRWYDLDVEFQGNIPDRRFVINISRNVNLSSLAKLLKLSGINFKLKKDKSRSVLIVSAD